jgi:hypothetical protein
MNKKDIQRTEYLRIRMSKQEKDLWLKYCESKNKKYSTLAREILLSIAFLHISSGKND